MKNKQEAHLIETSEGGYIRVYFDGNSDDTILEIWDPYSAASSDGWVTLTLDPQAASILKQAL